MVSSLLPFLYLVAFVVYDREGRVGEDPPIPWYITCTVDYLWFLCLPAGQRLMPKSPPLEMRLSIFGNLDEAST